MQLENGLPWQTTSILLLSHVRRKVVLPPPMLMPYPAGDCPSILQAVCQLKADGVLPARLAKYLDQGVMAATEPKRQTITAVRIISVR